MTTGMHSDDHNASASTSFGSVVPDSGMPLGAQRNQLRARTLKLLSSPLSFLLHLSALVFLITHCALHIKARKELEVSRRRLSDQVRLLLQARLDGGPSLTAFRATKDRPTRI